MAGDMIPSTFMKALFTTEENSTSMGIKLVFNMTISEGEFHEFNSTIMIFVFRKNLGFSQNTFISIRFRSMIITGCSPWTLYEFSNFQGQSACWYPADTSNCYPSFFRDENKMNGWAGQVSSVRHGCFSAKKFYGEPMPFEISTKQANIGSDGQALEN